jgi:hypothetical protein
VPSPLTRLNKTGTENRVEPTKRGKHRHLLEDPDFKRWYYNMCRGSKVTADVYVRRLGGICINCSTTPKELVERGRSDSQWLYNFTMDLVTKLETEGKAGSYIASNLKAIRSWLNHNGVEFKRKIKIRGADDTPTLRDKRTLTNNQLRALFLDSPPQTRCICALIAQAGVRPEVVGSYEGTDGLRIGDLPEMKKTDTQAEMTTVLLGTILDIPLIMGSENLVRSFILSSAYHFLRPYISLWLFSMSKPNRPHQFQSSQVNRGTDHGSSETNDFAT